MCQENNGTGLALIVLARPWQWIKIGLVVAGATLISYMIYTSSAEVEAKLGTRYLYLTVPLVVFGILRYLYLVDAHNEGGDPARLLTRDLPLLLTLLLWIAADVLLLYFQRSVSQAALTLDMADREAQLIAVRIDFGDLHLAISSSLTAIKDRSGGGAGGF